jgi:hypothetical protein
MMSLLRVCDGSIQMQYERSTEFGLAIVLVGYYLLLVLVSGTLTVGLP